MGFEFPALHMENQKERLPLNEIQEAALCKLMEMTGMEHGISLVKKLIEEKLGPAHWLVVHMRKNPFPEFEKIKAEQNELWETSGLEKLLHDRIQKDKK